MSKSATEIAREALEATYPALNPHRDRAIAIVAAAIEAARAEERARLQRYETIVRRLAIRFCETEGGVMDRSRAPRCGQCDVCVARAALAEADKPLAAPTDKA